jgi:alkylation response protein AidB-like acyl-CoA dehydrogenase
MSEYRAPVREMLFVINELAGLEELSRFSGFEEATPDLVEAILGEAAQLAGEVIAPTNRIGDATGTRIKDGQVRVAPEFSDAYRQYVEGGWAGLAGNPEHGGQGLPFLINIAVEEMWQSANLAWSLCPLLTQGAAHALEVHGSDELRTEYSSKLTSGEWTGTMNLSEPQAGSDLAAIRTQAVPEGDHYRISGQKIFITYGDHDMTDNVIHLVLARTKGAPEGGEGLSLFLVPKRLPDADGNSGDLNGVKPVSVEHKLGIHGSPTCVLSFENAIGFLLGAEHNGLACMFTMMNHARLNVGLEGISIAERAYQQALGHARDRVQGNAAGHEGRVTIIHHPDVRRMLMTIKAEIEAMRAVAYVTAAVLDRAGHEPDPKVRAAYQARLELMTPVVKGWITESGQHLTSIALQIHGGTGYIEEAGAAQHYRDARIATIYEGTTGIQANDLVGRKIIRDGGAALTALLDEMGQFGEQWNPGDGLATVPDAYVGAVNELRESAAWLLANYKRDATIAGAVSFHLLMQMGLVTGAWQMARAADCAADKLAKGGQDEEFYNAKLVTVRFYIEQILPRASAHGSAIRSGGEATMVLGEEQF